MSDLLFGRKVELVVESLLITDLRVQFRVKKSLKKQPNTCEVQVANLNENSRAALQKGKRLKVILSAGYQGNIAQLFSGDSKYCDQIQDRASWNTKIMCGDGERHYQFARVSKSFGPGTRVADVVTTVAKATGLQVSGDLDALAAVTEQFVQGYSAFGLVATELDHLLKSRGFSWSIQDGQLQVLQNGGALKNSVILLSPSTGLIGSPEHGSPEKEVPLQQATGEAQDTGFSFSATKKKGPAVLKVKSLLQPGLMPGRKVKIESRGTNGVFKIETVTHTGDTHSGDWYSEIECLPST